ncbi:hypothetical protein [Melaminivora alkalimesophila]|uniref:Uncharacterized protein n=1 Tax=Melaminivora alkalimesophila TaxID=1165852 RepID=A0A317REM9_9BURK|nr:hypothetical protein [Melaminivora alkalimesophila]PWW46916.1 hypothetical protein DFR36_103191 [Melaminivora alkalimesophila]
MHPQNVNTDEDVSPTTGKPQPGDQATQEATAEQTQNKESAQRRDLESNIGSDNQTMERRGANLDKF